MDPRAACSYMALAHGGDRGIAWQTAFCGGTLGFARSDTHAHLLEDLQCVRPRFFLGMSHFWNRVHADFRSQLAARLRAGLLEQAQKHLRQQAPEAAGGQEGPLLLTEMQNLPDWEQVGVCCVHFCLLSAYQHAHP